MKEILYVVTVCDYDGIRAHLSSEAFTDEKDAKSYINRNVVSFINDGHSFTDEYGRTSTDFDDEDVSENQCEYWWNNSTCYWQIKIEALPICDEEKWYIGASYRNAD